MLKPKFALEVSVTSYAFQDRLRTLVGKIEDGSTPLKESVVFCWIYDVEENMNIKTALAALENSEIEGELSLFITELAYYVRLG